MTTLVLQGLFPGESLIIQTLDHGAALYTVMDGPLFATVRLDAAGNNAVVDLLTDGNPKVALQ